MSSSRLPPPGDPAAAERPTRVRHVVVGVCTLMAVLLYLDRNCVGFATNYIREDLGLTESQVSWFVSIFFLSYGLAQVPSGWLSDRFGARPMLVIYILGWSVFMALTGLVVGIVSAVMMRLLMGLFQAGAYPSSASLLSRWVPITNRANASAIVSFGGRVGGALAPFLTAILIVLFVPRNTPVQFTSDEILQPYVIADRLVLAAPAASEASTGKAAGPAGRVWLVLSDAQRKSVATMVETARAPLADLLRELRDTAGVSAEDRERIDTAIRQPAARAGLLKRLLRLRGLRIPQEQRDRIEAALSQPATKPEREELANLLNDVMRREDFFRREDFADSNLVGEATTMIARLSRKEIPSTPERLRFHRVLLETSFPAEVGTLYVRGWRPVMYLYGAVGILVAGVFWFYFRDQPSEHPGCNRAEQDLIAGARVDAPPSSTPPAKFPIGPVLKSPGQWLLNVAQIGTNIGWIFIPFGLPRYLDQVHHVPIVERGFMSSMPMICGTVGLLLGGRFADWLTGRMGLKWGRRLPMLATRFVAAAGYGLVLALSMLPPESPFNTPWAYTAAFCLVSFGVDAGLGAIWAFYQDIGGKYVGGILGWGNMWGNLGAFVAPHLYNHLLKESPTVADWNRTFCVCLASLVVSGLSLMAVDSTKPIVANDATEAPAA